MIPSLTIGVPTFNRAPKLKRLLEFLRTEIDCCDHVTVLISDNASTDETESVLDGFRGSEMRLICVRQPENLGVDANIRTVYDRADSDYIWFMADDDLPLKGALHTVLDCLQADAPDILRFSFIQPPGSTVRQFTYPEPVRIISTPAAAIEHAVRMQKLSCYIVRKTALRDQQFLDSNMGAGFMFMALAIAVLADSPAPRVAVISEPLATCDEDFQILTWSPGVFLTQHHPLAHHFVEEHCPELAKMRQDMGYCTAITFAFAAANRLYIPERPEDYRAFVRELDWRLSVLIKEPTTALRLLALKYGFAHLWRHIRPLVRRFV